MQRCFSTVSAIIHGEPQLQRVGVKVARHAADQTPRDKPVPGFDQGAQERPLELAQRLVIGPPVRVYAEVMCVVVSAAFEGTLVGEKSQRELVDRRGYRLGWRRDEVGEIRSDL